MKCLHVTSIDPVSGSTYRTWIPVNRILMVIDTSDHPGSNQTNIVLDNGSTVSCTDQTALVLFRWEKLDPA